MEIKRGIVAQELKELNAYSPEELGRAEAIATIMNIAEGFRDGLLNKLQMLDEIKGAIAKL